MNTKRNGLFSSSAISALMKQGKVKGTFGVPALTYIEEKKREIKAGRSLSNEFRSTSTDWGNMCEHIAHDYLPIMYKLVSNSDRLFHHSLPWCGVPDGYLGEETVTDIKCPWTLSSFFNLADIAESEPHLLIENLKKGCPEYFWQLISNAILSNRSKCELILFMPKKNMLHDIKLISKESEKYFFHKMELNQMPWTSDDSDVAIITIIKFNATNEDKKALTDAVEAATIKLNEKLNEK